VVGNRTIRHLWDRSVPEALPGTVIYGMNFLALPSPPIDFNDMEFGIMMAIRGIGIDRLSATNTSSMMSAVPPEERGAASGMRATFQN
jgi:hypothetical protein